MSLAPSLRQMLPADIVRGINHLDPLPATTGRLVAMLRGGDESLSSIASVMEHDHALVASLLKRANAARYAGSPPRSLVEALLRLGTVTVLDALLDGHLRKLLTSAPAYGLDEHDLWLHGAASQCAVRTLRAECPALRLDPIADLGALLHDIGKLILARYLDVDARDLVARAREQRVTYTEAERQVFGFDHTLIGAAIAEHWNFPAEVAFAIRHHHDRDLEASSAVLDAVVLANLVAKTVGTGLGAEGLNFSLDTSCHQRLGLTFDAFGRICLATKEAVDALLASGADGR